MADGRPHASSGATTDDVAERADRFLVIGAGFSGLGVCAGLRRGGIAFDCVDASDAVGGNWHHGVYESAHIISSRRTTEYADYPMPASWPDFPSAAQMSAYLERYAEHWNLHRNIELQTRVDRVEPAGAGADERWLVTFGSGERRRYRGIVIANGHHWKRRWPEYPGEFRGEIMHSKDYKRAEVLRGKRVLVIGGGNSACDIAVEAARVGAAAHVSLRRGYWFMPKTLFGRPTVEFISPWVPVAVQRAFVRAALRVVVGRYEDYGLPHPDHRVFDRHPTINTELLHFIRHGRVSPHPDVARYDGDEVEFVDGGRVKVDLVVCATGFCGSIPFVDEAIVPFEHEMPQLVGGMFHPRFRNLYVFGYGQPRYGAGPLITAGADALAAIIRVQPSLEACAGALLAGLGAKMPERDVADPMKLLRQAKIVRRLAPRLPMVERLSRLRARARGEHPIASARSARGPVS